ncbi:MAG TPA: hypothetical protein IAA64_08270 [Candidatus Ornithocaccomicrobium faecavium]|uniref:Uncharacterized protein n=1 Tax=Candidatus Ornithocaccomicrobium faecavium TaxID=2840890 RepID=A0A9D1P9B0_9FIRM|nr:hypothetical protein [Clostridiales bacterium]HIV27949.1 hypothetical protein [Candidatus Ornithocaccomicrobium faecavium]
MVRLDPIPFDQVRSITFSVKDLQGLELTIVLFSRAKQRYARITVALQNDTSVEAPWANPIVCDTPISEKKFRRYFSAIQSFDVEGWKAQYGDASEGDSWSFRIEMKDGYVIHSQGCGDYPAEWFELVYLYDQLCPFWRCFATRRRAMPIGIVAG